MTREEINEQVYNDINKVLTEITVRRGVDFIKIDILNDIIRLPKRIPKIYTWYIYNANDAKEIFQKLNKKFQLEFNKDSIGQYLYVYETEN